MAFNPYYQPNYYNPLGNMPDPQQMYRPQCQQSAPIQQPSQPMSDRIWVQGEEGARAYLVAPNNLVPLWDSERNTIYLKSADASGIPSIRIIDYNDRITKSTSACSEHICKCGDKFVKIEDFKEMQIKIEELQERLEALNLKPTPKTTKTTKESVE